jgi:hypothetical protein
MGELMDFKGNSDYTRFLVQVERNPRIICDSIVKQETRGVSFALISATTRQHKSKTRNKLIYLFVPAINDHQTQQSTVNREFKVYAVFHFKLVLPTLV